MLFALYIKGEFPVVAASYEFYGFLFVFSVQLVINLGLIFLPIAINCMFQSFGAYSLIFLQVFFVGSVAIIPVEAYNMIDLKLL